MTETDEGGAKAPAKELPNTNDPQPAGQLAAENDGPAGVWVCFLRQQLPCSPEQQAQELSESALAANGATEANEKNRAKHAATTARSEPRLNFIPIIPAGSVARSRPDPVAKSRTAERASAAVFGRRWRRTLGRFSEAPLFAAVGAPGEHRYRRPPSGVFEYPFDGSHLFRSLTPLQVQAGERLRKSHTIQKEIKT